jgi:hypothetical protein
LSDPVSIVVLAAFAVLILLQTALAISAVRRLRQHYEPLADEECPAAMVLLCLRGGDPFLHRSLGRLISQDYPDFRVRIVIDSERDEAHRFVREALGGELPPHVEVLTLQHHFDTCTYKMSGILEGTKIIPPEVRFVALMDGDTIPHSTWLRELAAPIVRVDAAVTTGNRWYFPDDPGFGNMCRFCWNAVALPLMVLFRIPWGGTMAVRRDLIEDPRLRERLRHAFSEDTTIGQFAHETGRRIRFESRLVIVNREDVGLRGFFEFETRQLLAVKLQHASWPWIASHGVLTSVLTVYPLTRLFISPGYWFDIAYIVFLMVLWAQELLQGAVIRKMLRERGERMGDWPLKRWWFSFLSSFGLPLVHLIAVLRAVVTRRIMWRGVRYRIGGRPPVQVQRDEWMHTPPAAPRRQFEST